MSKCFVEKVNKIRSNIKSNHFQAIKTYKRLIKRQEKDFRFKKKSVEEVYETIIKMKSSNAKGNNEITSRLLKQIPHYAALAITHLYTHICRTGKFPDVLKIARLTPILKQGKPSTDPDGYRPISNLNTIEKVIEQLMREDIDEFLVENNIVPEHHHGARANHSTVTAKLVISEEVKEMKDKQKSIAITATDLSAAFDTCDSYLLLNMLEHIGFRGLELEIMCTYLTDRSAYVEIQGFCSSLTKMPDCSVVQGGKMSSTLYTIYTLDATLVPEIMTDNTHYKEITETELEPLENVEHEAVGFIDDVTHVTGANDLDELEIYINKLYSLLLKFFNNKILKINGEKTKFLTIPNSKDDDRRISIKINHNTEINESETLKILGFIQNKRNTMENHLNWVASKIGMTLAKLRPIFEYISDDQRKRIVSAKVKSIALYGLPLIIGQPQSIVQKACTLIMRANRAMFTNREGLRSTEAICNKLSLDEPRQDIIKTSLKFIHKIVETREPKQISKKLIIPRRKVGKIYTICGQKVTKSTLGSTVELFNAIPVKFRNQKHKRLKSKLKKVNIEYSLFK